MTRSTTTRQDIYTSVTNAIITELEKGVRPWVKPWSAEYAEGRAARPLRHNGVPYAGINILILWTAALAQGFGAPIWMTFRQAKELGAHVRKGERGSQVVYANTLHRTEETGDGETIEQAIPYLKAYTVFNTEQIEGLPEHYYAKPEPKADGPQRIAHAEAFFAQTRAQIVSGGTEASYNVALDQVRMPPIEVFRSAEAYYATLAHEVTHWTRHPDRLARDFGRKRFGDDGYAREELVAELGAAFLCADLELEFEVREDHAAYIGHWLQVLRSDKRAIFTAAAQRAADYLQSLQPVAAPVTQEAAA
ncbi:MAG: DUF1738 domain-containing protein [Rhodospirillaceae bacterium]|nr:DUF1738 domain-containing protein [Rhodospirillaceae bacterium]